MKHPVSPSSIAALGLIRQQEGRLNNSSEFSALKPQTKVLSPVELAGLFSTVDHVLMIDVRRPDEIKQAGGFPVYLGIQLEELENSLPWIPRERTIVTVSNKAFRGSRAADILTRNGFKVAGAISVHTYKAQGGKLTISPRPCWLC